MKHLECMSTHYDGSHWGLADWYPEIEEGIRKALALGIEAEWTTDWYSSKKEIASANITKLSGNEIIIEASVLDDFDTNGYGDMRITVDLDDVDECINKIRKAIDEAWDEAEQDRKDNQIYVGYKVILGNAWVETYIFDSSGGMYGDEPPGDNYHQWGWQEDTEIPDKVKDVFEDWLMSYKDGECTCNNYTIKEWSE